MNINCENALALKCNSQGNAEMPKISSAFKHSKIDSNFIHHPIHQRFCKQRPEYNIQNKKNIVTSVIYPLVDN